MGNSPGTFSYKNWHLRSLTFQGEVLLTRFNKSEPFVINSWPQSSLANAFTEAPVTKTIWSARAHCSALQWNHTPTPPGTACLWQRLKGSPSPLAQSQPFPVNPPRGILSVPGFPCLNGTEESEGTGFSVLPYGGWWGIMQKSFPDFVNI